MHSKRFMCRTGTTQFSDHRRQTHPSLGESFAKKNPTSKGTATHTHCKSAAHQPRRRSANNLIDGHHHSSQDHSHHMASRKKKRSSHGRSSELRAFRPSDRFPGAILAVGSSLWTIWAAGSKNGAVAMNSYSSPAISLTPWFPTGSR